MEWRRAFPLLFAGTVGSMIVVAWCVWFFTARVTVYETSLSARLEAERSPHSVDSPLRGRIKDARLRLGQRVEVGDVLLELDPEAEAIALASARASLERIEPELAALNREREDEEHALRTQTQAAGASEREVRARLRRSEIIAQLKNVQRGQADVLYAKRLVASIDTERATAEALEQEAANVELENAATRVDNEHRILLAERKARIAAIQLQVAQIEEGRAVTLWRIQDGEQKLRLRVIRAPISGRIGELAELHPGTVVAEGQRLASIVPEGGVRIVAEYVPAASLGRIREGQRGQLRLDGFPWMKYGVIDGRVTRVGSEHHEGRVRVELAVIPNPRSRIPIEHGMPGVVEIEIERESPASLVLGWGTRTLGGARGP